MYLDYNATTPVDPRVVAAMLPYLTTCFGNPSSSHAYGADPAAALVTARAQLAVLIGALPPEIVFTGSGSEANLLALRGAMVRTPGAHIITQATEHPAVLQTCQALARLHGVRVTVLPVGADGRLDPATAEQIATARGDFGIPGCDRGTGQIPPYWWHRRRRGDLRAGSSCTFSADGCLRRAPSSEVEFEVLLCGGGDMSEREVGQVALVGLHAEMAAGGQVIDIVEGLRPGDRRDLGAAIGSDILAGHREAGTAVGHGVECVAGLRRAHVDAWFVLIAHLPVVQVDALDVDEPGVSLGERCSGGRYLGRRSRASGRHRRYARRFGSGVRS
ncbi:aminotransferase class V-fold PLP-dependent enzyme [Nocardia asteroides]|nr:aminotransferase class V-fold PLP-dependent enzyme [Nocardia asteroides]